MHLLLLAVACSAPEPLDLPDDPAATGVPVGVRTVGYGSLDLEVWYPASDDVADEPGEAIDFRAFVSDAVDAALGDYDLALIDTIAVRDAPLRRAEAPYPVVLFSHGFGGTRLQSPDLTTHLASRGYVVVATDHEGRSMQDLLPCLFLPPLDGCNLEVGADPAVADIPRLLDWADQAALDGVFAGALDTDRVGLAGHSAGGNTTGTVGSSQARFDALLPMASGTPVTRDVPTVRMAGTCDETVSYTSVRVGHAEGFGHLLMLRGAGHLAFSDLCQLDLGALAAEHLQGRDDVNAFLLQSLVQLGTDGCPQARPEAPTQDCLDGWLPLEASAPAVRYFATVLFDDTLRNRGPGLAVPDPYDAAILVPGR